MKIHTLHLVVQKIPPIALRNRHVLILLRDSSKRFVLGSKKIYPAGIFRMVGGGVEKKEMFRRAASRELYEELGVACPPEKFTELAKVICHITDAAQRSCVFTTCIYFFELGILGITPNDDLDGIIRLTEPDYEQLIRNYKQLPQEIDPRLDFAWYDYGQIYAAIHTIALQALQKIEQPKTLAM